MTVLRQTEKQFQQAVEDYARLNGWLVYHTRDSRGSEPGFPDLVMVRESLVVFAELKREGGKLTTAQARWLNALLGPAHYGGVVVRTWRPSDWPKIEETLMRQRAP